VLDGRVAVPAPTSVTPATSNVIPAQAGIQGFPAASNADALDSRLRGNDGKKMEAA